MGFLKGYSILSNISDTVMIRALRLNYSYAKTEEEKNRKRRKRRQNKATKVAHQQVVIALLNCPISCVRQQHSVIAHCPINDLLSDYKGKIEC